MAAPTNSYRNPTPLMRFWGELAPTAYGLVGATAFRYGHQFVRLVGGNVFSAFRLGTIQGAVAGSFITGMADLREPISHKRFAVTQLVGGAFGYLLEISFLNIIYRAGLIAALPATLSLTGAALVICANTALALGALYVMRNFWASRNVASHYKQVDKQLAALDGIPPAKSPEEAGQILNYKKWVLQEAYKSLCWIQSLCNDPTQPSKEEFAGRMAEVLRRYGEIVKQDSSIPYNHLIARQYLLASLNIQFYQRGVSERCVNFSLPEYNLDQGEKLPFEFMDAKLEEFLARDLDISDTPENLRLTRTLRLIYDCIYFLKNKTSMFLGSRYQDPLYRALEQRLLVHFKDNTEELREFALLAGLEDQLSSQMKDTYFASDHSALARIKYSISLDSRQEMLQSALLEQEQSLHDQSDRDFYALLHFEIALLKGDKDTIQQGLDFVRHCKEKGYYNYLHQAIQTAYFDDQISKFQNLVINDLNPARKVLAELPEGIVKDYYSEILESDNPEVVGELEDAKEAISEADTDDDTLSETFDSLYQCILKYHNDSGKAQKQLLLCLGDVLCDYNSNTHPDPRNLLMWNLNLQYFALGLQGDTFKLSEELNLNNILRLPCPGSEVILANDVNTCMAAVRKAKLTSHQRCVLARTLREYSHHLRESHQGAWSEEEVKLHTHLLMFARALLSEGMPTPEKHSELAHLMFEELTVYYKTIAPDRRAEELNLISLESFFKNIGAPQIAQVLDQREELTTDLVVREKLIRRALEELRQIPGFEPPETLVRGLRAKLAIILLLKDDKKHLDEIIDLLNFDMSPIHNVLFHYREAKKAQAEKRPEDVSTHLEVANDSWKLIVEGDDPKIIAVKKILRSWLDKDLDMRLTRLEVGVRQVERARSNASS